MATMTEEILEILVKEEYDRNDKLQAIQNIKILFKPPDKIFGKLKLESLLKNARTSLENKTPEKSFLYKYGTSLMNLIGRDPTLDSELLYQLEYVLAELQKEDQNLTNELVTRLWSRLKGDYPNRILDASKQTIEKTVLDWVDAPNAPRLEFLSKMSAGSPKLFQTLTSALYEVLARTCAHERVLQVTEIFVEAVKRECQKERKNFLVLYPKGCRRLVSFLMIPPNVVSSETRTDVVSSLFEMFLTEQRSVLIILSHFKEWVGVFKTCLKENQI